MISDLAELTGLTQRAIRFYEERGLIAPTRDRHNQRRYSVRCRERLVLIAKLRGLGLGLVDIQAVLDKEDEGPDSVRRLARWKLIALQAQLDQRRARIALAIAELGSPSAKAPRSVASR